MPVCTGQCCSGQAERHGLLGLKVDMSLHWLRRMCEQVFGHLAKRRRDIGQGRWLHCSLLLLLLADATY